MRTNKLTTAHSMKSEEILFAIAMLCTMSTLLLSFGSVPL